MGKGRGEEDRGESPERDRHKKGKIGRPKNKPPPPPRPNPVSIIPRPSPGSQDHQDQGQSRTPEPPPTGTVTDQAENQALVPTRATDRHPRQHSSDSSRSPVAHGHGRRTRVPRSLFDKMAFDECLTKITFLSRHGNYLVTLSNAFISPHWRQSLLPMGTAEMLEHSPTRLEGDDVRTALTPRGSITYDKAVCLWMELTEMEIPQHPIKLPVTTKAGLGVSIILGKDFIDACFGENNWPPREGGPHVNRAENSFMPYGIDPAARAPEYYYTNSGEGVATATDTYVNWTMSASTTMDYALTAVGTGMGGYDDEIPSGEFSWDG